jgi:hypothetical protein
MGSIILDLVQPLPEPGQFLLQGEIDGRRFSYQSCLNEDGTYTAIDARRMIGPAVLRPCFLPARQAGCEGQFAVGW